MSRFADLRLVEPLRRALKKRGYITPTAIQAAAIPPLLGGRDVMGVAQTGTGKTAAFALPVLQGIARPRASTPRPIKALVLTPTRELAAQIGASFGKYSQFLDINQYVLFGGVPVQPQITALERGVDVLVATPGRLLDLHRQGRVKLDQVGWLVLDEADRMLDMGFVQDIRQICRHLPGDRQSALFSATMPPEIVQLAAEFLRDPVRVEVARSATPVASVDQRVMYVKRLDKPHLLAHLLETLAVERGLVFVRTRRGADRLVTLLRRGGLAAETIHGERSQAARTQALEGFRRGEISVLVATDVASRGLDVSGVSHVFNYDLPSESESYVHRIGRTARAGQHGMAIAFCDETEGGRLRDIERLIGRPLTPVFTHPWHSHDVVPGPRATQPKKTGRRRRRRR